MTGTTEESWLDTLKAGDKVIWDCRPRTVLRTTATQIILEGVPGRFRRDDGNGIHGAEGHLYEATPEELDGYERWDLVVKIEKIVNEKINYFPKLYYRLPKETLEQVLTLLNEGKVN